MAGHRKNRTRWRGFDPENRDDQLRGVRAERRDKILGHLASLDPEARKAALDRVGGDFPRAIARLSARRGPNRFARQGPAKEVQALAETLALASLGPVREALTDVGGGGVVVTPQGWPLRPPNTDALPMQAAWGLPLLASCSPQEEGEADALDEIPRLVYWLGLREFGLHHPAYRALLAEAIAVERELWVAAAEHRGPSPRIPFAYQFTALEQFWSPEANAKGNPAPAVCLRCGTSWFPYRPINAPPRCTHCNEEDEATRAWPRHAVAPHLRGSWWLHCQQPGCGMLFHGRRDRLFCIDHRTSRRTVSKRKRPGV